MLTRYTQYNDIALGDNLYTPVENAIYEVTALSLDGHIYIHRCGYYNNYVDLEKSLTFSNLQKNFFKVT